MKTEPDQRAAPLATDLRDRLQAAPVYREVIALIGNVPACAASSAAVEGESQSFAASACHPCTLWWDRSQMSPPHSVVGSSAGHLVWSPADSPIAIVVPDIVWSF